MPRTRLVLALAMIAMAFVSGGSLLSRGLRGEGSLPRDRERLFDQVIGHVQRHYVDSLSTDEVFEKALYGMLEELGDPHTAYLTPDRLKRLEESTTGMYTGLGVRVDGRDGWPTVIATIPNSPAERAGLLAGDRLVEIDGRPTRGWTDDEIRIALRGAVGTDVEVALERPTVLDRLRVKLTRDEIRRQAVRRSSLLEGRVGYVDVDIFSDSTDHELTRAIDSLTEAGMKSLVLDLRSNPGGLLTQGVAVADLFLDSGQTIVSMRGRSTEHLRTYRDSAAQRWPNLPIAVLVDEATASAAEIVAGALQDHDRAVILGQTTLGKGSAQAVFQTSVGGGLKLTTARWYTPVGRSIERGVPRDPASASDDPSEHARFTTDAGRTVLGGGGIVPDLVVGDTVLAPAEHALQVALGERVPEFRDALTAYAISLKGANRFADPFFEVTSRMRDDVWLVLQRRGFAFDRSTYNGASSLVSRLIAREVARYVFGPQAETQRAIRDDDLIQRAARILAAAATPVDVFDQAGVGGL